MPRIKMPDGSYVNFPDTMSDEEINSAIANMSPEVTQAPAPTGFMATPQGQVIQKGGRAVSRFVPDMMEAYDDTVSALSSPLETVKSMAQTAGAFLEKGGRKFEEFALGEEIPPTPGKEELADEVIAGMPKSLKEWMNLAVEHPFDTAMLGATVTRAKPLRMAGQKTREGLGAIADEAYRADMGIPKSLLDEGKDIARFGAREGIVPTRAGLTAVDDARKALNERLNAMIENSSTAVVGGNKLKAKQFHISSIIDEIDTMLKQTEDIPFAKQTQDFLLKERTNILNKYRNKPMLTAEQLHKYKTTAYESAYKRDAKGKDPKGKRTDFLKQTARGAKEALEKKIKNYGPVNKEWGSYAQLRPYLEKRVNRKPPTEVFDQIKRSLGSFLVPGSRAAIKLRQMADDELFGLMGKHSPAQLRKLLEKMPADDLVQGAWVAGQADPRELEP